MLKKRRQFELECFIFVIAMKVKYSRQTGRSSETKVSHFFLIFDCFFFFPVIPALCARCECLTVRAFSFLVSPCILPQTSGAEPVDGLSFVSLCVAMRHTYGVTSSQNENNYSLLSFSLALFAIVRIKKKYIIKETRYYLVVYTPAIKRNLDRDDYLVLVH